ncbi:MAG: PIN domain-containing protein [Calditrichaeota bacterium]|nr:MAG: PIN domain-containing protein [Calditrichota bacterium]
MSKVLIDTNILVYSVDKDSQYHETSQCILFENSNELFTTSKNLSEFLVVMTRSQHSTLSARQALVIINEFTSFINILFPSTGSFLLFQTY